jgi:hypothetical protein
MEGTMEKTIDEDINEDIGPLEIRPLEIKDPAFVSFPNLDSLTKDLDN